MTNKTYIITNTSGHSEKDSGAVTKKDGKLIKEADLAVNYPDVNVYSGDILFYINRVPVNRNISQSETYKMVFSF
jgi:hypothetical protein